MLAMILIVVSLIYTATVLYSTSQNQHLKVLTLAILLGLITYFTHGVLNNFLDTDKLAVPVWSFIAIIVALDVYHRDEKPENKKLKH